MSSADLTGPGAPPSSAEHQSALAEANRESIALIEQLIRTVPDAARIHLPQHEDWLPGVLAHSTFLPADTVLTGTTTRTAHFFVVLKGSCTVIDALGGRLLIQAPYLGITEPCAKRSLHAHEDCLWIDFHETELTTVGEIRKQFRPEGGAK